MGESPTRPKLSQQAGSESCVVFAREEEGSALENGHFEVAKACPRFSINVRREMMLRKKVEAIRANLS